MDLATAIANEVKTSSPQCFQHLVDEENKRYDHLRQYLVQQAKLDECYESSAAVLRSNGIADPPPRSMDPYYLSVAE